GGRATGARDLALLQRRRDAAPGGAEALALALAGFGDPRTDDGRALPDGGALEVGRTERRQLDVQVDPVEERTRDTAEVTVALEGRAAAALERRAAAAAGVRGG